MNRSLAFLFVILLSLAGACGGDDDLSAPPEPAPETTPVPRSTAPPSPTATPRIETSATPQTEDHDDGLTFLFGPGVDSFDRSLIVRAVEVTRELLRDESGVQPPAAVFAYQSPVELAGVFKDEALEQAWRSDGMANRLSRTVAEASYRGIVINTGIQAWKDMDATERLRVVAHEFVHVIQLERAGLEVADATFSGPNTIAPRAGPFWLLEGSAEVVSWLVIEELALGSYTEALLDYAEASGPGSSDLAQIESYFGFAQTGQQGLGIAVLATDYVLRSQDLDGLFDLWRDIRRGATWETAFARNLGMAPAQLYQSFSDYYETTWADYAN